MTWLADTQNGRPASNEREKLLTQRERIQLQIEELKSSPVGKSNAAIQGRQEDLLALARKMVNIDKKLGRTA
jgi:SMC interacting uncharacterized protein involved in chromosome segregation